MLSCDIVATLMAFMNGLTSMMNPMQLTVHDLCLSHILLSFHCSLCFGSLLQEVVGSTSIFIALHRSMLQLKRLVIYTMQCFTLLHYYFSNKDHLHHLDFFWLLVHSFQEVVFSSCLTFASIYLDFL